MRDKLLTHKRGLMALLLVALAPQVAAAEEVSAGVFTANNIWMMICAGLVFIMPLGFATLEAGLT